MVRNHRSVTIIQGDVDACSSGRAHSVLWIGCEQHACRHLNLGTHKGGSSLDSYGALEGTGEARGGRSTEAGTEKVKEEVFTHTLTPPRVGSSPPLTCTCWLLTWTKTVLRMTAATSHKVTVNAW